MASMIFSTVSMFFPQESVMLAGILLCVAFFGIYIPCQERKKRREAARKRSAKEERGPEPPMPAVSLEQIETLKKAGLLTAEEYREKKRGLLKKR